MGMPEWDLRRQVSEESLSNFFYWSVRTLVVVSELQAFANCQCLV